MFNNKSRRNGHWLSCCVCVCVRVRVRVHVCVVCSVTWSLTMTVFSRTRVSTCPVWRDSSRSPSSSPSRTRPNVRTWWQSASLETPRRSRCQDLASKRLEFKSTAKRTLKSSPKVWLDSTHWSRLHSLPQTYDYVSRLRHLFIALWCGHSTSILCTVP